MTKKLKEEVEDIEYIEVLGARVHNLQNIDVRIPRNKLTVITGLSGSGKSSLAFDTIHAEGQRRYLETFSAYARQFLGKMERPEVDKITGLSPVISIEQKTTNKNPRSTVGTVTEIYDFMRLLFARASIAYSSVTGEKMVKYTDEQIVNLIIENFNEKKIMVLAPIIRGRKGHYKELFESFRKKGFLNVRIDGEVRELIYGIKTDRYKTHFIEIVVDKLKVNEKDKKRLNSSVQLAMKHSKGVIMIQESQSDNVKYYSRQLMCPTSGISYDEPAPHSFSFNSPQGACPHCKGLGTINEIDIKKIIPNPKISIAAGGIAPLGKYRSSLIFWQIEAIAEKYKFTVNTAIEKLSEEVIDILLYGSDESFKLKNTPLGSNSNYFLSFNGIANYVSNQSSEENNGKTQNWANQFIKKSNCSACGGTRLKEEALNFKIHDKNIAELVSMDVSDLAMWLNNVDKHLTKKQLLIGKEILKEINARIGFLLNVGLDYLSLNRSARSLSGGESQRIRLATQIGSQLVNVLYILDEPSIGLHQRDNIRLINTLKQLRDIGNSIIVVEHDKEMILSADHIIDIGPRAGIHGGKIMSEGSPEKVIKSNSLTAKYLNNSLKIAVPKKRRAFKSKFLILKGASGNNLKNIDLRLPLGKFICITGVSGSGKSSVLNQTLYPILSRYFYKSLKQPLPYESIEGIDRIDKVITVDQAPIGRTPRSNPVTYTGVFSDIRSLYSKLPEAKIRGYKPGRFSFNVKGGRCEGCRGAGVKTIEMNFLPDVYVLCDECNGNRYNRETLEVRYKGKSISSVLNMTINQAVDFFENIPSIRIKLAAVQEVGLGYITLGQSSTTLSGGESQRIKLSAELSKRDTGNTLYLLDEPTTGLHFEDINVLLNVLNKLVDKGNTVVVIEHNLDVIKMADHIIDLGVEGGKGGGYIVCEGSPEAIVKNIESFTAQYLKLELNGTV